MKQFVSICLVATLLSLTACTNLNIPDVGSKAGPGVIEYPLPDAGLTGTSGNQPAPPTTLAKLIATLTTVAPYARHCTDRVTGQAEAGRGSNLRDAWNSLRTRLNPDAPGNALPSLEQVFLVTPNGNVIRRPNETPSEGEVVHVVMYAPTLLRAYLRIDQGGTVDNPNDRAFYGQPTGFTDVDGETEGEANVLEGDMPNFNSLLEECSLLYASLGPYSPDFGSFEIRAALADAEIKLGEVKLPVRRRYIGTLTFGAVYSAIEVPDYTLIPVDPTKADSLHVVVETSRRRGHVVAGFAPVLLGPRTIEGGVIDPQLDLFFGVDVTAPADNLFGGLTLNLNGLFLVHGGIHLGKVEVLPEDTAVRPEAEVPSGTDISAYLVDDWRLNPFLGVSIDAAAASKAFASAVRGLLK